MPWKIKRDARCSGSKPFGVVQQNNDKLMGCHATRNAAKAQMAALYASGKAWAVKEVRMTDEAREDDALAKKDVADEQPSEDKAAFYDFSSGATTFAELDVQLAAAEAAQGVYLLTDQFNALVYNVMNDPELANKASAVAALAAEFGSRLTQVTKEDEAAQHQGKKSIPARIKEAVRGLLPGASDDAEPDDGSGFTLWKEQDGRYRWLAVFSNNYRDDDNPPEILSKAAHREFVDAVDAGEWPMPELWFWHVKGTRFGETDLLAFDDDTGFTVAMGNIDPQRAHVAEYIAKEGDWMVSHGMPPDEIERSDEDQSIITRYRSQEISPLPADAAANKLTWFLMKEEGMAIPEHKREALAKAGFNVDELDEKLTATQAQASGEQRESKEVEPVEAAAKDADTAVIETEIMTEEPQVVATPQTLTVNDVAAAFQAAIAPVLERLNAVEGQFKQLAEAKEVHPDAEPEPANEMTPAASLASMMKSAVIGEPAAQVDGRKARYDAPKETTATKGGSGGNTPFPVVNALIAGQDYREALNQ